MALTFIDYTAPATYSFTFDYLDVSNVKAYVNGVQKTQGVHYTVQTSPKAVVFTAGNAPAAGSIVRIKRETYRLAPLVDFNNGSTLIASDLDTALTQTLYINQEVSELNDTTLAIEAGSSNYTALDSRIVDLANPVNAKDATNKTYVDSADALKVSKAGDSMSGVLSLGNNKITDLATPSLVTDASNKAYVDAVGTLRVLKSGDSMSGPLAMGNNKITGLGSPTVTTDAANKTYIDTAIANVGLFGASGTPLRWQFTATAGQTNFVITGASASDKNNYIVFINGEATDSYTFNVATSTITLAPQSVGAVILVIGLGYRLSTEANVPDFSVTTAKLADDAVTNVKILNGTIASAKLAATGVTAAAYGSSTAIPTITVNAQGQVTGASSTALNTLSGFTFANNFQVGQRLSSTGTNVQNSRLGIDTLGFITTGSYNTGVGYFAGRNITTAEYNVCLGSFAGWKLNTGNWNVAIGGFALNDTTIGSSNVAVGIFAGQQITSGYENIAVGAFALNLLSTGFGNIGIGAHCLKSITTGERNAAVGWYALNSATGSRNVAFGGKAGGGPSNSGSRGIYIGDLAGESVSSGTDNILVGIDAGALLTSGSRNILLGNGTGPGLTTGSNNIYIGDLAGLTFPNESNTVRVGNAANNLYKVTVAWTTTSDKRDKTEINPLTISTDFINKLKPISYKLKESRNSDNAQSDAKTRYGFAAQDILEIEGENSVIIDNSNVEQLGITDSYLIPILVKAIQDLSAQVEELKLKVS